MAPIARTHTNRSFTIQFHGRHTRVLPLYYNRRPKTTTRQNETRWAPGTKRDTIGLRQDEMTSVFCGHYQSRPARNVNSLKFQCPHLMLPDGSCHKKKIWSQIFASPSHTQNNYTALVLLIFTFSSSFYCFIFGCSVCCWLCPGVRATHVHVFKCSCLTIIISSFLLLLIINKFNTHYS